MTWGREGAAIGHSLQLKYAPKKRNSSLKRAFCFQGCIFCLTCSHPELIKDEVLTSAYVKYFRTVTRNAVNKGGLKEKRLFLTSLKQICNECLIKFSENQSAPKLENRKTSPCSSCAPNLLHVLVSRILGYHNLCSPAYHLFRLEY